MQGFIELGTSKGVDNTLRSVVSSEQKLPTPSRDVARHVPFRALGPQVGASLVGGTAVTVVAGIIAFARHVPFRVPFRRLCPWPFQNQRVLKALLAIAMREALKRRLSVLGA